MRRDQLLSAHVQLRGALRPPVPVADRRNRPRGIPPLTRRAAHAFARSPETIECRWWRALSRNYSVCRVFAHWALGQDGRAAGGARRADGTGRRDGRRAQHPVESCDICSPGHRSLRLPLQEAHLRDMDDPPPRSKVSTS